MNRRPTRRNAARFVVVLLLVVGAGRLVDAGAPAASAPTTQPATSASRPAQFQPGIRIDWGARRVLVNARVVMQQGPLEFFACFRGKEHESILRLEARAAHVFMALGLVGLQPGHPSSWSQNGGEYQPAQGDLIDVELDWVQDGQQRSADAFEWLLDIDNALPPLARPWIFAGSQTLADGSLAADRTGAGLALVDLPDSLLSLSRARSAANAELWAVANPAAIPPEGTQLVVSLAPARRRMWTVELDPRGQLRVGSQWVEPGDLADLIRLNRQIEPGMVQDISDRAILEADREVLRSSLTRLGVPPAAYRLTRESEKATTRSARE